jgi:periplasmic protein TonB
MKLSRFCLNVFCFATLFSGITIKGFAAGNEYAVQILISNTQLTPTDKKFKGVTEINEEAFTGIFKYKYTTGKTTDLTEANTIRTKMIDAGFKDAFIVTYQDGVRTTTTTTASTKTAKTTTTTTSVETKTVTPVTTDVTTSSTEVTTTTTSPSTATGPKKGLGYAITETEAEFPGGYDSLQTFLQNNLNQSQTSRMQKGEWKNVFVSFVVDKNGKVKHPQITSGINSATDSEVMRVMNLMPDWKPATIGTTSIEKQFILPVGFYITETGSTDTDVTSKLN